MVRYTQEGYERKDVITARQAAVQETYASLKAVSFEEVLNDGICGIAGKNDVLHSG